MGRELNTTTLDNAARNYAAQFLMPTVFSTVDPAVAINGHDWVMRNLHNATFKDTHEYLVGAMRGYLGPRALDEFEAEAKDKFTPRDEKVFRGLLADKLAIDMDGEHIPGKIGTTQLGNRVVGKRIVGYTYGKRKFTAVKNVYWPVYAGEGHERAADSGVADALPPEAEPLPVGALNTKISNVAAIGACNFVVDDLDKGSTAATVRGRVGAQPADPDAAESGVLLFTLTCNATAFGTAVDDTGKATATAAAVSDDTSADATDTLGYCRAGATGAGSDDTIDGEAGTSGADFNFNTLSIVAGATVSLTSWTVSMPEA